MVYWYWRERGREEVDKGREEVGKGKRKQLHYGDKHTIQSIHR